MAAKLEQIEYTSVARAIPIRRVWAMPSKNTFDVPPMKALVKGCLYKSKISVDPFARNKRWATHTNDLNPDTAAEFHVDALEFLKTLAARAVIGRSDYLRPAVLSRSVPHVLRRDWCSAQRRGRTGRLGRLGGTQRCGGGNLGSGRQRAVIWMG